jgi:hypothetical protein
MTEDTRKAGGTDLQELLDIYGADVARWPAHAQGRADHLLAAGPETGRMMAEAKALDAVLALAPLPATDRRVALADRIVAEALQSKPEPRTSGSGVVIPWPGAARERGSRLLRASRSPAWRAAALLAASLLVGVFIGAQDLAPGAVHRLVEAVEYNSDFDQAAAVISGDGLMAALDEEFL